MLGKMASHESGDAGQRRQDSDVATVQQEEGTDVRSKKRQRMDQLIQMSMDFAGVHEAHATRTNPSHQPVDRDREHQTRVGGGSSRVQSSSVPVGNDSRTAHASHVATSRNFESKRTWTPEEDAKLVDLVSKLGRKWGEIAKAIASHDRKRCRERYINHLDPTLCRAPWSDEEDSILLQLFAEFGKRWATISGSIAGRSPDDVKNRWIQLTSSQQRQETENEPERPAKQPAQRWTVAENEALRALVEANGAKDWFFVASQIPGRTDLQCRQHWHRVLDPEIKKGRSTWTSEEDDVLQAKVEEWGHQWEKIANELPGRLGKQCRERYLNHIHPSINKAPWTSDEDAALESSYKSQPGHWAAIAGDLPGRTENAIKNRWNALLRKRAGPGDFHSGATSRDENELR